MQKAPVLRSSTDAYMLLEDTRPRAICASDTIRRLRHSTGAPHTFQCLKALSTVAFSHIPYSLSLNPGEVTSHSCSSVEQRALESDPTTPRELATHSVTGLPYIPHAFHPPLRGDVSFPLQRSAAGVAERFPHDAARRLLVLVLGLGEISFKRRKERAKIMSKSHTLNKKVDVN